MKSQEDFSESNGESIAYLMSEGTQMWDLHQTNW